jgi:hypothetical protein
MHPDREIAIWERIADAYTRYCSGRNLSAEAKRDIFQVLLLRSTTSDEDEVFQHLKLNVLTPEQARDVMKSF